MDVQNILYVLAFIAFFVLRTYNNYKKQEEKRKKVEEERKKELQNGHDTPTTPTKPFIPTLEETILEIPSKTDYKPYEQTVSEPVKKELVVEKVPKEPKYTFSKPESITNVEEKYEPELPEELIQTSALHSLHHHSFEIPQINKQESADKVEEFDLRDAIIKQIILERPVF